MGVAKKRKLEESIRERAFVNRNGVYVPRTEGDHKLSTWPVCQTCKRAVERVSIEGYTDNTVDVRVWCHGTEATMQMVFPYGMTSKDDEGAWRRIHEALNNGVFFDPSIA